MGPIVGPLVAVISFVCSVGNIPLAAVLWNGGISFGGVVAFIFADLIVLPILNIYRKYYGLKMAGFLFVTFYVAMATAALIVELIFNGFAFVPSERKARWSRHPSLGITRPGSTSRFSVWRRSWCGAS
jgi:uncharacterized membrane protein YraQ (UPF0718 family)